MTIIRDVLRVIQERMLPILEHPLNQQIVSGTLHPVIYHKMTSENIWYLRREEAMLRILAEKARDVRDVHDGFKKLAGEVYSSANTLCGHSAANPQPVEARWVRSSVSNRALLNYLSTKAHMVHCAPLPVAASIFLPCLVTYEQVYANFRHQIAANQDHPYRAWIELWSSPDSSSSKETIMQLVEELFATAPSEDTRQQIQHVVGVAMQCELTLLDSYVYVPRARKQQTAGDNVGHTTDATLGDTQRTRAASPRPR